MSILAYLGMLRDGWGSKEVRVRTFGFSAAVLALVVFAGACAGDATDSLAADLATGQAVDGVTDANLDLEADAGLATSSTDDLGSASTSFADTAVPAVPTIPAGESGVTVTSAVPSAGGEATAAQSADGDMTSSASGQSSTPTSASNSDGATTASPANAAPASPATTANSQTTAAVAGDINCPNGIASELPLVLTGDTVPGETALGLATSPQTPRNPCGDADERACFNAANAERVAQGLTPYKWDGDLADLGRSHSADMTQKSYFSHGSSTTDQHHYQERGDFLGLKNGKFSSVVENIGSGYGSGEAVVAGFMSSPGHRAVIMGEGHWSRITHMACGKDGRQWSMEFGVKS